MDAQLRPARYGRIAGGVNARLRARRSLLKQLPRGLAVYFSFLYLKRVAVAPTAQFSYARETGRYERLALVGDSERRVVVIEF